MAEPLLQNQPADRPLPQRALFVWSREDFPFYARLAIESLLVNAPDFEVQLHLFGETPRPRPTFGRYGAAAASRSNTMPGSHRGQRRVRRASRCCTNGAVCSSTSAH